MPGVYTENMKRTSGDKTKVIGQDFVKLNGHLIAIENDHSDDSSPGYGDLISEVQDFVTINGKKIIVLGDKATPDVACPFNAVHCTPYPAEGSDTMSIAK